MRVCIMFATSIIIMALIDMYHEFQEVILTQYLPKLTCVPFSASLYYYFTYDVWYYHTYLVKYCLEP